MENLEQKCVLGNFGDKVRSDCRVEVEYTSQGGRQLDIKSKVAVMYGESILKLVQDILDHFLISDIKLKLEDAGALPWVIAARIEAAIKRVYDVKAEFLLPVLPQNKLESSKERSRFSRLYLPGNTPSMMINAGLHKPDGVILDLEDAVAPEKKYEARFIVRNALRNVDFYQTERMVRINQIPAGLHDLEFIVSHHVNLILIPKCESALQIREVNNKINALQQQTGFKYAIWLMPIVESALGVIKAYEIASASPNVVAMAIGLEDYTADIGTLRTEEGTESFYARSAVVNACRAAGIQPIDSVFSDVSDMEALARNVQQSKRLGFDGMGCIHPRQIEVIHQNYAPESKEILKAQRIIMAFDLAISQGHGVVSLGTKMIDAPVVKRAQNTLQTAIKLGVISENWKTTFEQN